jgi:hypothetical protein
LKLDGFSAAQQTEISAHAVVRAISERPGDSMVNLPSFGMADFWDAMTKGVMDLYDNISTDIQATLTAMVAEILGR